MKIKRLFIPLSKEPFEWFKSGFKTWELRRYDRQYTEKNVTNGQIAELRCGYSNPANALWGVIKKFFICNNLEQVYEKVYYQDIFPFAIDKCEAIEKTNQILNLAKYKESRFIVFNIKVIETPEFISLSDEYYKLIKEGKKKTTIRHEKRIYKNGFCIVYSSDESELIKINKTEYIQFKNISEHHALSDGFNSLAELTDALKRFYPDIKVDDFMTIVHFENLGGNNEYSSIL